MKARYKIGGMFMLLTIFVIASLCLFIYYQTTLQQEKDFNIRLHNRALTIASLLFELPSDDYYLLSKLDSATTNLLVSENINIYNNRNERIYRFARNYSDTVTVSPDLLNEIRIKEYLHTTMQKKKLVAIYYKKTASPVVILVSATDENGKRNLKELRLSLLLAFIAGTFLSIITGRFFSTRLLKPIKNIASNVKNISVNNIEERLAESDIKDEWNDLLVTFNDLLSRLQVSFDIQGRFISNASHELSTPLTAISNQIDVALQNPRSNEEYVEVLRSVQADTQHMSALIQQLLNIASTSKDGAIHTEQVRIDEVIMEIPLALKRISNAYHVHTYFDELPDDEKRCTVNGNYELLLSAFKNIAENGCKYAPDHTVNITLSFIENKILLLFSNYCNPVNESEIESFFQPFQRGSNSKNIKGYGLGLSLTRRIILLHRGEIKAELIEPGSMLLSVILPSAV